MKIARSWILRRSGYFFRGSGRGLYDKSGAPKDLTDRKGVTTESMFGLSVDLLDKGLGPPKASAVGTRCVLWLSLFCLAKRSHPLFENKVSIWEGRLS